MERIHIKFGILAFLIISIIIVNYNYLLPAKAPEVGTSITNESGQLDIKLIGLPENQTEDLESALTVLPLLSGLDEG